MLDGWTNAYPIASIEDPHGEDHRDGMIEFTRSARMAKWNERLRIQDSLGSQAFLGRDPLKDT